MHVRASKSKNVLVIISVVFLAVVLGTVLFLSAKRNLTGFQQGALDDPNLDSLKPDVVSSVTVNNRSDEAVITKGEDFFVIPTITNQGDASTSVWFDVGVYMERELLKKQGVYTYLAPGESFSFDQNDFLFDTLDAEFRPGVYYVWAYADVDDVLDEENNEQNNLSNEVELTILEMEDYNVAIKDSIYLPEQVKKGYEELFYVSVSNTSDKQIKGEIMVKVRDNTTGKSIQRKHNVDIAPGTSTGDLLAGSIVMDKAGRHDITVSIQALDFVDLYPQDNLKNFQLYVRLR